MSEVIVKQCVITILTIRGEGKPRSPMRRITEVWDAETGEKIAEKDMLLRYDPSADKYSMECEP